MAPPFACPAALLILMTAATPAAAVTFQEELRRAFLEDRAVPAASPALTAADLLAAERVRSVQMGRHETDLVGQAFAKEFLDAAKGLGLALPGEQDLDILSRLREPYDRYRLRPRRGDAELARRIEEGRRLRAVLGRGVLSEQARAAAEKRLDGIRAGLGAVWQAAVPEDLPGGAVGPPRPVTGNLAQSAIAAYLSAPLPGYRSLTMREVPAVARLADTTDPARASERVCINSSSPECRAAVLAADHERARQLAVGAYADCRDDPTHCVAIGLMPVVGVGQALTAVPGDCMQGAGSCTLALGLAGVSVIPGGRALARKGADLLSEAARALLRRIEGLAPALARSSPHIGVAALAAQGVKLGPEAAAELRELEAAVARFNGAYKGGYHGSTHQVGKGSVADMVVRTVLPGFKEPPAGMSRELFDKVRLSLYKGALVHDVEATFVIVQKDGRAFLQYGDEARKNPVRIADLGAPLETRQLADGSMLQVYAKPPDSRSALRTTLTTLNRVESLAGGNDPLVKYFALKGTAFSPEEKALRDRMLPILEAKIRTQYGAQADEVLRLATQMAERLGGADFFNHYVRDVPAALKAARSLETEFQDKFVKVTTSFGFFRNIISKDKPLADYLASLPQADRRNFTRNLLAFKTVGENPAVITTGMEEAAKRVAASREFDAVLRANPGWPDLRLPELVEAMAKAPSLTL